MFRSNGIRRMTPRDDAAQETDRFRHIFRRAHADHAACARDEWLNEPCRERDGSVASRPLVWSRRNGPWRRSEILWVGAAPGNAGGLGSGDLGAHGTRIPFGGDIAGGNLEVLLSAIGTNRNETFIVASLNQLPERGGGEPTSRELAQPVGDYANSAELLRDTVIAAGPRLIIALGNVALRTLATAITTPHTSHTSHTPHTSRAARRDDAALRMPGTARLAAAGFVRDSPVRWPTDALPPAADFIEDWQAAWQSDASFHVLQLLHPSAQNMSPFAGVTTLFHQRMLQTLAALRAAAQQVLGREPPRERPHPPQDGIYALPEWRERVAPTHQRYDALWRERGV